MSFLVYAAATSGASVVVGALLAWTAIRHALTVAARDIRMWRDLYTGSESARERERRWYQEEIARLRAGGPYR